MKKYRIKVYSSAGMVQGHGVLSAGEEQIRLIREGLSDRFEVVAGRKGRADITHYHTVDLPFFLSIPLAKAQGKAVGYVHFLPETIDGSLKIPLPFREAFFRYLIAFYRAMDALVVVNPAFIPKLAAYGVPEEKIHYIPNYVDRSFFYPLDGDKGEIRRRYGVRPETFTVVCAGQLQTRKGVLDFARTARRMPDVQFVWAGGFSFGRMTEGYGEIRRLMEDPPRNLTFTGMIPRERMREIYQMGDVMFLPSYDELFPMTILEAMSCHIPLLLRDIEAYPGILYDFYRKGDGPDQFEAILRRMQRDPAYREAARDGARRGSLYYSRGHVLAMWDAFYTSLVAETAAVSLNAGALAKRRLPI